MTYEQCSELLLTMLLLLIGMFVGKLRELLIGLVCVWWVVQYFLVWARVLRTLIDRSLTFIVHYLYVRVW